jgi:two-component system chemotaxis response regulator CheB
MRVVPAEHEGPLRAGRVQVIPSGRHLLVTRDQTTALIVSGAFPPSRPSADLLLATLATACGPRAVAVVLSGNGHDGATGATAVHDLGGTVVASDEATSEVFAMPAATIAREQAVDHVLGVQAIGPWLAEHLARAPTLAGAASMHRGEE